MSKLDNAAQLELARWAVANISVTLADQTFGDIAIKLPHKQWLALVGQFDRLADKEQKQIAAGVHGAKGGAPKGNQNARKKERQL